MKIFTLGHSASANSRPRGTASAILPLTLITIIRSNETLLVVLMEILRLFRRNAFFSTSINKTERVQLLRSGTDNLSALTVTFAITAPDLATGVTNFRYTAAILCKTHLPRLAVIVGW